ncbi:6-carboxytetrahydropterin synthase QueD [Paenibacillus sp. FSL R7-0048]|uniref:6-carboxytetrahydropterin synthase QueD n=1 Tax=Paenibacillus TaxID=44249 RepID=UPI00096C0549|nr:6-carboxytetrahydropterin synthase QueD [Paenibacillus odorifer]OMD67406.1 6-carboxytetrahydropterin synthase QueD [Paenibacillus odorifer]OMD78622.1 6-carboxytetrahydropterin synthase QueD [Paenibacillus odorifer]
MKVTIGKEFLFEAAHKLPKEEVYGSCQNLHGHRYELAVEVTGDVNDLGWVCNFKELKAIVKENVIERYDHAYLNDYFDLPTVEIMAVHIFNVLSEKLRNKPYDLNRIVLYETQDSYAEIKA